MTLVYQTDSGRKRLLRAIKDRKENSLREFFNEFGPESCSQIKVVAEILPQALNILGHFRIAKKLNQAVDQVRRDEAKRLREEGYEPILRHSHCSFPKRLSNLTAKQPEKLTEVLQYDLKTTRAYFLKEAFNGFWHSSSPHWARLFFT